MPRPLKESKNLNCKVDKHISNMLEDYIAETGMSKTATVERALKEYIEKYIKETHQNTTQ